IAQRAHKKGVGEPLNESTTIRTTKQVYIDTIDNSQTELRQHMLSKTNSIELVFGEPISSPSEWINSNYMLSFTPLVEELSRSVELLSFEFEVSPPHPLFFVVEPILIFFWVVLRRGLMGRPSRLCCASATSSR